jgi:hypothetical protein
MTKAAAVTGMIAIALAACGKGDKKDGAATSAASRPPVVIDVAAVNALVPAALKDRLVFEKRDLVIERGKRKTTYTVAAPAGWAQDSKMFAHLKASATAALGSRLEVGSNCDGECTPKPWEVIADRVNFAPRARGKVTKDDRAPGRRTMIAEVDTGGAAIVMVTAWWTDGDRSYHTCTASLDDTLRDAAPAFDRACQAVAIDGDD